MKKNLSAFAATTLFLVNATGFAASDDYSKIVPFFGGYKLDAAASSKNCNDALAYSIRPYSDGSKVSVQSPGFSGFTLENSSTGWSNVYDLNMFFSKDESTVAGQRAWQINTMVSLFGVERQVKKFMFVEDKEHPFIIATRRSFAKFSEGIELAPDTVICAYRKE